jgi:hypothetical protein
LNPQQNMNTLMALMAVADFEPGAPGFLARSIAVSHHDHPNPML